MEEFKERVRDAFTKAKEDISLLKEALSKQDEQISKLIRTIEELKQENLRLCEKLAPKEEGSTGNEGVYSFIHSTDNYSFTNHALAMQGLNNDVKTLVERLSRQEFLTFMTLYQLGDENPCISYSHIAQKLNLSEGCIRTYISSLIKKGVPIVKKKHNNRLVVLSLSAEFKALGLKKKLIDLFYGRDSQQASLQNTW